MADRPNQSTADVLFESVRASTLFINPSARVFKILVQQGLTEATMVPALRALFVEVRRLRREVEALRRAASASSDVPPRRVVPAEETGMASR